MTIEKPLDLVRLRTVERREAGEAYRGMGRNDVVDAGLRLTAARGDGMRSMAVSMIMPEISGVMGSGCLDFTLMGHFPLFPA